MPERDLWDTVAEEIPEVLVHAKTKTPFHAQVKLLTVCLLTELALCCLLNAIRLHFAAVTEEFQSGLSRFFLLALLFNVVAMNLASMSAAVAAILKKADHRAFAMVTVPSTAVATAALLIVCILGGSQANAAFALGAYVLAVAVYRFAPGKIWPPDELK